MKFRLKTKIRYGGREYSDPNCEDVMSVIENNGEVTLPIFSTGGPRVTKGQRLVILLVLGAVILAALVVLATR